MSNRKQSKIAADVDRRFLDLLNAPKDREPTTICVGREQLVDWMNAVAITWLPGEWAATYVDVPFAELSKAVRRGDVQIRVAVFALKKFVLVNRRSLEVWAKLWREANVKRDQWWESAVEP